MSCLHACANAREWAGMDGMVYYKFVSRMTNGVSKREEECTAMLVQRWTVYSYTIHTYAFLTYHCHRSGFRTNRSALLYPPTLAEPHVLETYALCGRYADSTLLCK